MDVQKEMDDALWRVRLEARAKLDFAVLALRTAQDLDDWGPAMTADYEDYWAAMAEEDE